MFNDGPIFAFSILEISWYEDKHHYSIRFY